MIDSINRWLLRLCKLVSGVAFCFMALIAFVDSISRMTNTPLLGGSEYVEFALVIFFFATLALNVKDDQQIRIGLFADLYKEPLATLEKLFTGVCEVIALGVLCWLMFDQAERLARFGTLSSYFKVPYAPFIYIGTAFTVVALWVAIHNLWSQRKPPVRPRPHAIPEDEV